MSLFPTGSASATEQLRRLREQAGALLKDRVEPAVSSAAATAAEAQPVRRLLDLLPLLAEYGGLAGQLIQRVRGQAGEVAAPAPRHAARHWLAPVRPVVVAAAVLGLGYLAYRLAAAQRTYAARSSVRRSQRPVG